MLPKLRDIPHRALSSWVWLVCLLLPGRLPGQPSVTTGQYDNGRSGANLHESILNSSSVNGSGFGKLFSRAVDGYVYAQPLYVSSVTIPGQGVHNVLYVATMHNSIYAFDADDPFASTPLWKNSSLGAPVPHNDSVSLTVNTSGSCGTGSNPVTAATTRGSTLTPEIGILSTPVIDTSSGTLYAVSASLENGDYCHKLHALDLTTGAEKAGSPVAIQASVPGVDFFTGSGPITFSSARLLPDNTWSEQIQRSALALVSGTLYIGFAVFHDPDFTPDPWHGWLLGYNARSLQQSAAFVTTPKGGGGGIWQSGTAPAADSQGNIYIGTGNGDWDGISNFSDSFLKLSGSLSLSAVYSPPSQPQLNQLDWDVGVGGPTLLAGSNLLISGSKQGILYLLDTNLKLLDSFAASLPCDSLAWDGCSQIRQYAVWSGANPPVVYLWGSPIHQDSAMPQEDVLRAYTIDVNTGKFNQTPASLGTITSGYPGGMLALSAAGSTPGSGIVWATTTTASAEGQTVAGVLRAFDASDVSRELWNSEMNPNRDRLGSVAKFALPTVVNGKVYVPTFSGQVAAYGSLACAYGLNQGASFDSMGGSGTVTVSTAPGCGWSASASVPWIQLPSPASGAGNGTVPFSVVMNGSGVARTGTIAVGGQTFTVSQTPSITDPPAFVNHLYQDLLDRQPDSSGLSYWAGLLNTGTLTRPQVAAAFFTSGEFSSGGLYIIDLYEAVLGRDPDFAGWLYWFTQLKAGLPQSAILDNFLSSPEFTASYGSLSNSQFVNLVYQNVLGRPSDPGGQAYYLGLLDSGGLTRTGLMDQFTGSQEFLNRVRAKAYANLLYMGFLRRTADKAGLQYWTNVLSDPNTLVAVIGGFLTSPEYMSRY